MATSSARHGSQWALIAVGVLLAGALPSASACACSKESNPVCGADGKTYNNGCMARCAKQTFTQGACKKCACPADEWKPVCAKAARPGDPPIVTGYLRTYSSRCVADCDKGAFVSLADGACNAACTTTSCPSTYDPVCGSDGKTYDNGCWAACAGNDAFTSGACRDVITSELCPLIDCSMEPAQVCATMKDGSLKEYLNSCNAECDTQVVSYVNGVCPDLTCPLKLCSTSRVPVCVTTFSGEKTTITNECIARCDQNVMYLKEGECGIPCENKACPLIYAPVCVLYKNGTQSTFGNACQAQCEKDVESSTSGECAINGGNVSPLCDSKACPMLYAPVCVGFRNGTRKAYDNACLAQCAEDIESSTPGECTPNCPCPKILAPVCGVEDGETYANSCVAECAGRTWTEGECITCANVRCASGPPVCATMKLTYSQVTVQNECLASCDPKVLSFAPGACAKPCPCPKNIDWVCGVEDGENYANACLAKCAGRTFTKGRCKSCETVKCGVAPPVCATMKLTGDQVTIDSACLANCNPKVASYKSGACPCRCLAIYAPVCGSNGKTYSNDCEAKCAGITEYTKGQCEPINNIPCDKLACPLIYAPVCVVYKNGTRSTFGNACQAQCEKDVESSTSGECGPVDCPCPRIFRPVCGVEDGETYANSCLAECKGRTWTEGACITCANVRCASGPPVCATMKLTGDQVTIDNECLASCNPKVLSFVPGACTKPCPCPKNIDWVCGVEDGENYANPCLAKCAGRTFTKGRCKSCETVRCAPGKPVCATMKLTGDQVTIANACLANCNPKVASFKSGACLCRCLAIYAPVCGSDGKTYSNDCEAKCAGITEYTKGECPCRCNEIYKPVCALQTNGKVETYDNECKARCDPLVDANAPLMQGKCNAGCLKCEDSNQISSPICIVRPSSTSARRSLTYPTPCLAECQGGANPRSASYYEGKCRSSCDTRCNTFRGTQIRDFSAKYGSKANGRVCCGNAREYPSLCYASCAGGLSSSQLEQCRLGYCTGSRAERLVSRGSDSSACSVACFVDPCRFAPTCNARNVKCMSVRCPSFFRFNLMGICSAQWLDVKTGFLSTQCPAPGGGCVAKGKACVLPGKGEGPACCDEGICWPGPVVGIDQVYGTCYGKNDTLPRGL